MKEAFALEGFELDLEPLEQGTVRVAVTDKDGAPRWFGDSLIRQPLRIPDLQRGSVIDLIRLLDYPNDYVPVLTRDTTQPKDQPATGRVQVIEKSALNARLARNYLVELIDRARIR